MQIQNNTANLKTPVFDCMETISFKHNDEEAHGRQRSPSCNPSKRGALFASPAKLSLSPVLTLFTLHSKHQKKTAVCAALPPTNRPRGSRATNPNLLIIKAQLSLSSKENMLLVLYFQGFIKHRAKHLRVRQHCPAEAAQSPHGLWREDFLPRCPGEAC